MAAPVQAAPEAPPRPPISGFEQDNPEVRAIQANQGTAPTRNQGGFNKDISAIGQGLINTPGAVWNEAGHNFAHSYDFLKSGMEDLTHGNYKGAAGNLFGAGIGGVAAIPSAVLDRLVNQPVTQLTGNPDIGNRAEFLAGLYTPGKVGASKVQATVPTNRMINDLVKDIGPENVPSVVSRMAQNERLRVSDVAPVVRTTAQGLVDTAQPNAMRAIVESAEKSKAGAKPSVEEAFNEVVGARPNVVKTLEDIKKKATDAGSEIINPAIKAAKPVDTSGVISAIDDVLKPAVAGIKIGETKIAPTALQTRLAVLRHQLTDGESVLTDPQKLHNIQSDLRAEAHNLTTSSDGAQRTLGKQLYDVRNKLVDAIDVAADKKYKPGLAKYRDAKEIDEAFKAGADFNKQGTGYAGLADHPDVYRNEVANMTKEQLAAHKLGVRLAVDQTINGYRFGARRGTDIGDVPFKQDKLEILFGKKEAGKLMQKLKDERDIAKSNSKWTQGSKTAETRAAQEARKPREVQPLKLTPSLNGLVAPGLAEAAAYMTHVPMGLGTALAVASGVGKGVATKLTQVAKNKLDLSTNASYARAAGATGPERQALIARLMSHPDVLRAAQVGKPNLTQKLLNTGATLGRAIGP